MWPHAYEFPSDETDTRRDVTPSARVSKCESSPPENWRARPPLESTTYTIVPGRDESVREEVVIPPLRRARTIEASSTFAEEEPTTMRIARPVSLVLGVGRSARAPGAEGEIDLDERQRARIGTLFTALGGMSHYDTLGISRSAGPTMIRRAYFALAAAFHLDRYYGKRLGAFRHKIVAIFMRVNEAYETLSHADTRAAYDAKLDASVARTPSTRPTPIKG